MFSHFVSEENTPRGLNQTDVELDMINAISAADIAFDHVKFTSYCELIECSRPIRFFIVSLMYNNMGYKVYSGSSLRPGSTPYFT